MTSDIMGNIHTVGPNQALIVSGQYHEFSLGNVKCRGHARERGCVVLGLCNIRFIQLGLRVHLHRGCPGIFSFIATRTIFIRALGLVHITIVFPSLELHFPQQQ